MASVSSMSSSLLLLLLAITATTIHCSSSLSYSSFSPNESGGVNTTAETIHPSPRGFTVELVHWRSPDSPFYDPDATPADLIQDSLRRSRARAEYLAAPPPFNGSLVVAPAMFIDRSYVMRFALGTPGVVTFALPDTGGTMVWVQCVPCDPCQPQAFPSFNATNSATYSALQCDQCSQSLPSSAFSCTDDLRCVYSSSYGDGSYSQGDVATDSFTFEDAIVPNIIFGCGYHNKGYLNSPDNSPGVIGLSYNEPSLFKSLVKLEEPVINRFSYCVRDLPGVASTIKFGAAAPVKLEDYSIKLSPNSKGRYIFADVDGLFVDGQRLDDIPDWVFQYTEDLGGGIMMDTGTRFTHLQSLAMDALVSKLNDTIPLEPLPGPTSWPLCYQRLAFNNITDYRASNC